MPLLRLREVMDKSNIAFALVNGILGLYILVALVLSRVRHSGIDKTDRRRRADDEHKGSRTWT
jgi:hypothetical protein